MNIYFTVNYFTSFGQKVYIQGTFSRRNHKDISKTYELEYNSEGNWKTKITFDFSSKMSFKYKYFIKNPDDSIFFEAGETRKINIDTKTINIHTHDEWQANDNLAPFLTSPFTNVFYPHQENKKATTHKYSRELIIRITVPNLGATDQIFIAGNTPDLGQWNLDLAIPLVATGGSRYEVNIDLSKIEKNSPDAQAIPDIEYKFFKKSKDNAIEWENGENHKLYIYDIRKDETFIKEHSSTGFNIAYPKFKGVAVPVFSLRTKNSAGIGEFNDIKKLADWAVLSDNKIIQLLPINDTFSTGTWTDSYPYKGISVMALHPIYINIKSLGSFPNKNIESKYNKERKKLNELKRIDYEAVFNFKKEYLHIMYKSHGKSVLESRRFKNFLKENKDWLMPYCTFCTLRDQYKTADFNKWGKDKIYSEELLKSYINPKSVHYNTIMFHAYVQYNLHLQLSEAVKYTHKHGIALKGDIPIGITPESVEAWTEPKYFKMNCTAGAPPDDFAKEGQNWGFPTYNWDEMEKNHYAWWKKRFSKLSQYFDAYRIDHVLGFFRIWEIPTSQVTGLMGHFNPALPYSQDELRSRGFYFDFYRHATPFIRYYSLKSIFKDKTDFVIKNFLDSNEYDIYTLKHEFNTQKKIETGFIKSNYDKHIRDGLYSLVSDVLFLEDDEHKGMFHPRISAQFTYSYNALSDDQKDAFNRLYDEFFYHRHNQFWKEKAIRKLPEIIGSTSMLTCAEDLGMIPDCVPEVLSNLKALSLEIQRMPKNPAELFANPAYYPYLSVCTTGTHDTNTLRAWWEEDRNVTQKYWNIMLHKGGDAPEHLSPEIAEEIIKMHTSSPAMLTILPIQDWLSTSSKYRLEEPGEERINFPANPKHYWRYRMIISLEELIKDFKK
ncbi:MAG: 4-alpha-glucanotransferase [Bacteroidales bacterium]